MGLKQTLVGLVEPDDAAWASAPAALRKQFYDQAGKVALKQLEKQLAKAIGANGKQMKARIRPILPDGSDGPVMEPHYDMSRVIKLMDYAATDKALTIFWHAGTGHKSFRKAKKAGKKATPFGTILQYHADGLVPHAPVRDVRMSKANARQVKLAMKGWWTSHKPKAKAPKKGPTQATRATGPTLPRAGRGPFVVDTREFRTILPPKAPGKGPMPKPPAPPKAPGFDAAAARAELARLKAEGERIAREKEEAEARRKAEAERKAREAAEARRRAEEEARRKAEGARAFSARIEAAKAERLEVERSAVARAEAGAREAAAGVVTRAEVLDAARGKGINELYDALTGLIKGRLGPGTVTGSFHGMSGPETFHSIEFEGITFHFDATSLRPVAEARKIPAIAQTIRSLAETPIPAVVSRHTKNVYFTAQVNDRDGHWKVEYNDPGHVSAATGGDGDIVVYLGGGMAADSAAHEMGHNWAAAAYGTTDPRYRSRYDAAIAGYGGTSMGPETRYAAAIDSGEPPVSAYATKSPSEDFAEAVRLYAIAPDELERVAPLRFKALEDLARGTT